MEMPRLMDYFRTESQMRAGTRLINPDTSDEFIVSRLDEFTWALINAHTGLSANRHAICKLIPTNGLSSPDLTFLGAEHHWLVSM